jgi:hypothetical protein
MNFLRSHWSTLAAGFLMFLLAWWIYRPKPVPPEPPAPAVRQKDGSLELERGSNAANGANPTLKPAGVVPKGGKIEREIRVTVDPNVTEATEASVTRTAGESSLASGPLPASVGPRCPQVTVDLSLVRMPDQTRRVIASSPNGSIVGGLDVPIDNPKLPRIQRWTASAIVGYDSSAKRNVFGGAVQYQKGPVVFTGGVIGGTVFTGAGIRF